MPSGIFWAHKGVMYTSIYCVFVLFHFPVCPSVPLQVSIHLSRFPAPSATGPSCPLASDFGSRAPPLRFPLVILLTSVSNIKMIWNEGDEEAKTQNKVYKEVLLN